MRYMCCERCGKITQGGSKKCKFCDMKKCNVKMKLISDELMYKYNIFNESWFELINELDKLNSGEDESRIIEELLSRKNNFIMNEIADNRLFSIWWYEKQVQNDKEHFYNLSQYNQRIILEQQEEIRQRIHETECVPKCPICSSTNIKKITMTTRAVKTATFGIAGAVDDAGKTYKCNNCGSKF